VPTRSELAKIHIAKKALRLTDDAYRRILRARCGKDSARDMTSAEILRILSYFKNLGWKPRPPASAPGKTRSAKKFDDLGQRPGMASPAQLRKIEVAWMTGPGVREKTAAALRHFLQHHLGASDPRFITRHQATAAIVAINRINRAKA
jgi:hypothetical protein